MGGPVAVQTGLIMCPFGASPASLTPTMPSVVVEGRPVANILDSKPLVNIPSFGMCTSLGNPQVAAATAAALGVLTPMPCVPVTTPWTPGAPATIVNGAPALTAGSTCQCAYGGVIQIVNPGSTTTMAG